MIQFIEDDEDSVSLRKGSKRYQAVTEFDPVLRLVKLN